jgi:hypothetical protein
MPIPVKQYTFANGTTNDATQVNADLDALFAWANGGVDNTNVGAAGFYASQILPTSAGQATFGGALPYSFNNGLIVNAGAPTVGAGLLGIGSGTSTTVGAPGAAAAPPATPQGYLVINVGGSPMKMPYYKP